MTRPSAAASRSAWASAGLRLPQSHSDRPLKDDWDKTLALREGDFQRYRNWS